MENKKEIVKAINNLTYSVIKKVKAQEDNLLEKVLFDYLGRKPSKKERSKASKVENKEESYDLLYDKINLGTIKYEMTKDNNLSIRFIPNGVK